jgi:hypothetical protein
VSPFRHQLLLPGLEPPEPPPPCYEPPARTSIEAIRQELGLMWTEYQRRCRRRGLQPHPPLPASLRYLRGMDTPVEPDDSWCRRLDTTGAQWEPLTSAENESVEERIAILLAETPEMTPDDAVVVALWPDTAGASNR